MLDKLLKKIGSVFEKGQPLEKLYPAFEAADSFLMTPATVTRSVPHVRDAIDLKRFMMVVVVALLPCTLFGMYNTGLQTILAYGASAGLENTFLNCMTQGALRFLPLYAITLIVGGHIELLFALIRKHEINEGFLVTSALFPLILPPTLPWWIAAAGIAFGVTMGKEVFGGTGMNIFNPALVSRCFIFFAYAGQMSGSDVWVAKPILGAWDFVRDNPNYITPEGFSGATALSQAFEHQVIADVFSFQNLFLGFVPGSIGETSALCAVLGFLVLWITGVGSYKTILGCILGALGMGSVFYLVNQGSDANFLLTMPPHYHLVMGGFAFGAVFMATDPVSSPATGSAKWVYGFLIGVLVVLVRVINPAYPEGMMLAILFMNLWAPFIDYCVIESRIKKRLANV